MLALLLTIAVTVAQFIPSPSEQRVIDSLNSARCAAGLAAVRVEPLLQATSHVKGRQMIRHDFFAHQAPWGEMPNGLIRRAGVPVPSWWPGDLNWVEALYRGAQPPRRALTALLESPAHRTLLMNPWVTTIGVSVRRPLIDRHPITQLVIHTVKWGIPTPCPP